MFWLLLVLAIELLLPSPPLAPLFHDLMGAQGLPDPFVVPNIAKLILGLWGHFVLPLWLFSPSLLCGFLFH